MDCQKEKRDAKWSGDLGRTVSSIVYITKQFRRRLCLYWGRHWSWLCDNAAKLLLSYIP